MYGTICPSVFIETPLLSLPTPCSRKKSDLYVQGSIMCARHITPMSTCDVCQHTHSTRVKPTSNTSSRQHASG
jgi:hypothetical protein